MCGGFFFIFQSYRTPPEYKIYGGRRVNMNLTRGVSEGMKEQNSHRGTATIALAFLALAAVFCLLCAGMTMLFVYLTDGANRAEESSASPAGEKYAVVIDPGHGGEDGGCSGRDGTTEKDLNLSLSLTLASMLRVGGVDVTLTRTEDILLYDRSVDFKGRKKVLDLAARLDCARAHPDADFISIHMNAFPQEKWNGLQVWYSKNDEKSFTLAKEIQSATQTYLQPDNDRRVKVAGSGIFLLDRAVTPAVLVECGFLSNPEECAALAAPEYQKKLSLVIMYAYLRSKQGSGISP